jgi:hypothetical protein
MRFKEWLELSEERFKGLHRMFIGQYGKDIPRPAERDLYQSRVSDLMKGIMRRRASNNIGSKTTLPMGDSQTVDFDPHQWPSTPGQIMNHPEVATLKGVQWGKGPMEIQVTPLDFDQETLERFLVRRFGFDNRNQIRNDAQRMATQNALMNDRGMGSNEPIIVVKQGNKYKLLEGWHRTMAYLIYAQNPNFGAPPDQIELIKNGKMYAVDFTRWKPVRIRAWVGQAA